MNEQALRMHDSRGAVLRTETNAKTVPCGNDARVLYKINLFRGKSGRTSGADQLRTGDLEVSVNVVNLFLIRNGKPVFPIGHGAAHQAEDFIQCGLTQIAGLP